MLLAIMSDVHDHVEHLATAIGIVTKSQCEYLLFAGDLISPPMLSYLAKFPGQIKIIWGNNEGEKVGFTKKITTFPNMELAGDFLDTEIAKVKIFMQHFPKYAELASLSGQYDLCIHGHTHEYRNEKVGQTILLNPGEIHGMATQEPGFVIFDTAKMTAERILL
jgi:uncharacterized protein